MEVEALDEFQRVTDVLPDSPVGTWRIDDRFGFTHLLTIAADGRFDLTVF